MIPMLASCLANRKGAEFLTVAIGRLVQVLTSVLAMRVITTFLSPEEAGRRFVFISLTAFFALLLVNPVGMYLNRKTHAWIESGVLLRQLGRYWGYLTGIGIIAVLAILVVERTLGIGVETNALWLLVLVAGSLLFNTANVTVVTILNMMNERLYFVGYTLLTLWLGLAVSSGLALRGGANAESWLLGNLIGQVLVFFVAYTTLRRKVGKHPQPLVNMGVHHIRPLFMFAWPLSLAVGLNWVQAQSYRFVLSDLVGLQALGLFATGYTISAAIMTAFESLFNNYYLPLYYKKVSNANSEGISLAWSEYVRYLIPFALLVTVFIVSATPFLTKFLVAASFEGAAAFVIWGALAELMRVLAGAYSMLAHARIEMRDLLLPNLFGALIALAGSLILPRLGNPLSGIGLSLALSGAWVVAHLHCQFQRQMAIRLPWRELLEAALLSCIIAAIGFGLGGAWAEPTMLQATAGLSILSICLAAAGALIVLGAFPHFAIWGRVNPASVPPEGSASDG